MTHADPVAPDEPFLPERPSSLAKARPHLLVASFILATWGTDLANSVTVTITGSDSPLLLGNPSGIAGSWAEQIIHAVVTALLAVAYVGRKEMGFARPENTADGKRAWDTTVKFALIAMIGATVLRALMSRAGVSFNLPSDDAVSLADQVFLLPHAASAGVDEELAAAAMAILMLRARWALPAIYLTIVGLRIAYHLYQGWEIALPAAIIGTVFLWCFLRYRQVLALVLVHSAINTISWAGQFLMTLM